MKPIIFFTTVLLLVGVISVSNAQDNLSSAIPLDSRIKTGKLSNGITYFIMQNKRPEKRAELRLVVNAGSVQEDDNQQGLAHFVEHMAFNGTTHFKKNELVNFLESAGIKFGPDLNAYTSFDETVYMLTLPTDSADVFEKGFLVLEDWAQGQLFDTTEFRKERGVVREEWRLGKGAEERMRNKYFPLLFQNSQYANRLPIGKKEVIDTASVEKVKKFYKDWYRPDLMAVVAIGDFDVNAVEEKIKNHFSKIPAAKNARLLQKFDVPSHDNTLIAEATDKEADHTSVSIQYKLPVERLYTQADYKKFLAQQLFIQMLSSRLQELGTLADPPFTFAYCYYGSMVRSKYSFTSYAYVKDQNIERGIETLLTESERARQHGFALTELKRAKESLLSRAENDFKERDKTESSWLTYPFVSHFLENDPLPGPEFHYNFCKQYLDGITLDEVNGFASKWITKGDNMVIIVTAPDKDGVVLPSQDKLLSLVKEIRTKNIEPYNDVVITQPLIASLPSAGRVISEKKMDKLNVTEWTLSNGAKVVLKPTDYKNDEIQAGIFSWGGSGQCSDADYMSAQESPWIMDESGIGDFSKPQLNKYMQGKIVWKYSFIGTMSEEIAGQSSLKDFETFLQLIHLQFTNPRIDSNGFSAYINKQQSWLENDGRRPENVFYDTMMVTMAQHHPRIKPMTLETLKQIDKGKAIRGLKERFADAGNFTFVFAGAFKPDSIKPLIEKYIASLPATGKKEMWKDIGVRYPKGNISKTVVRGVEPKSRVNLQFTGDYVWNGKNNMIMTALQELVNIKLREKLREDMGGTYGVSVRASRGRLPEQTYNCTVTFGCAPENLDSLIKAAFAEIEKIKKSGPEAADFKKVIELMTRKRETDIQDNYFWVNQLEEHYKYGDDESDILDFNKVLAEVKPDDLKAAANLYFNMNNYAKFVLLPEEAKKQ